MKPTLGQCFPSPLTRQWPSTGNSVSCECQQLYALVSLCCCLPRTHLLVLHQGQSNNMVTAMPKGPKYVDFKITARTTEEDLSAFLIRAESASSTAQGGSGGRRQTAGGSVNAEDMNESMFGSVFESPFSPRSRRTSTSALASSNAMVLSMARSGAPLGSSVVAPVQRHVVVVCLHGLALATPAVAALVLDVLMFGQVAMGQTKIRRVLSLRIVAFNDYRTYMETLSEPLRAAFAVSTYMSAAAMDSAAVLQQNDPTTSSIVNKRYMMEVVTSKDGTDLVETVTIAASVMRYMRHLILVVRGSMMNVMSEGTYILRKIPALVTLVKAAAMLFAVDDQAFSRRSSRLGVRSLTTTEAQARSASAATRERATLSGSHQYDSNSPALTARASNKLKDTTKKGIVSFAHVVVSPSDVMCLLPFMIGHLLSLRRDLPPPQDIIEAACIRVGGLLGVSPLTDAFRVQRNASSLMNSVMQDPSMWDAKAVGWGLSRRKQTSAAQHWGSTLDAQGPANTVTEDLTAGSLRASNGGWHWQRGSSPSVPTAATMDWSTRSLPSASARHTPPSLNDASAANTGPGRGVLPGIHIDEVPQDVYEYLNYCEVKEMVRATIIARSAPAPA